VPATTTDARPSIPGWLADHVEPPSPVDQTSAFPSAPIPTTSPRLASQNASAAADGPGVGCGSGVPLGSNVEAGRVAVRRLVVSDDAGWLGMTIAEHAANAIESTAGAAIRE
jgi:hypothetical protein